MMDIVNETMFHLQDSYTYYLDRSDRRVSGWLFMQSYTPTLLITALYVLMAYVGPKMMKTRQAFNLKYTLVFYNMFLVILNAYICYELIRGSILRGYSWICQAVHYGDDPDELRIARTLWWYYISKLIEFLDTVFFILRKKNNQLTFLHVYHHGTMFPLWWIGVKWVAGGLSTYGALINAGTHVLNYTYYGISALGPEFRKYLWWKKHVTRLQLIQFSVALAHATYTLCIECAFPRWMSWGLLVYVSSMMSLFLNFYYHSYIKKSEKRD